MLGFHPISSAPLSSLETFKPTPPAPVVITTDPLSLKWILKSRGNQWVVDAETLKRVLDNRNIKWVLDENSTKWTFNFQTMKWVIK